MTQSAMRTLTETQGLSVNMQIEPVEAIRLPGCPDVTALRATVVDPQGGSDSLRWNDETYSPASLLAHWEAQGYVHGVAGVHSNFQIVGHAQSLREEANQP